MHSAPVATDVTVLTDVVAPAEVFVGPAGVFVVLQREDGGRADLRAHVRTVRAALDAVGLNALQVESVLSHPDGGEEAAVDAAMQFDVRHGPRIIARAIAALAPDTVPDGMPPWVATIAGSDPVFETPLQDQLQPALERVGDTGT